MITFTNILFFVILFLACIVSGLVGFGSNILALPFLSLFLDVKVIVPVLILTVLCNGVPRLLTQYRSINLSIYLTMLPLALLGGFAGIHLIHVLHEGWMKLMLAGLMLFIAERGIYEINGARISYKLKKKANPLLLLIPFLGGLMQAAFACGGPIFNMYILLKLHKKDEIRATMFAIGSTSAGLIALQYYLAGIYHGQILHFVVLLIPAVLLAYAVSEHIFKRINRQQFLYLIYFILIFAGLMTGWQALQQF